MTYSAGGDPEMELDCSAVMADVWLLLDGECDPGAKQRLQVHLQSCSQCFSHFGIEQQIKSLVSRKCGGDRAPDGLRERLRVEIRTTRIEYRSE
jgi:mycothiol system anti-sigma-R factor